MRFMPAFLLLGLAMVLLTACGSTVAQPQPQARVAKSCTALALQGNRTYETYFASNTATLTQRNRDVVSETAKTFFRLRGQMVTVLGYADRLEDQELGWKRARAVAAELAEAGIPAEKIYAGHTNSPPPGAETEATDNYLFRKVAITPRVRWNGQYENECIDAIRRSCYRPLDNDQKHDCDNALYLLAPAAGHIATAPNGMPLIIY